jgi:pyridoxamine 5'-phosphate oxidase
VTRASPLPELRDWIDHARSEGLAHPASVAFVTVADDGQPSARTVTLKRLQDDALVFTTTTWTRKAREIESNPRVALLFHWPALGRQVHISGEARWAERALAHELFAERDPMHQLQTIVSRQGEPIESLDPLRDRLDHLLAVQETPPSCPEDWAALLVIPATIELWSESTDRIHRRRLFERRPDASWTMTLLSP